MSKHFFKRINSLNFKVALSLVILGLFLLAILFILIVPKMQKEQINHTTTQIENMITLTNLQLKLAVKFLINHGKVKKEENKIRIQYELEKITNRLKSSRNIQTTKNILREGSNRLQCSLSYYTQQGKLIYQTHENTIKPKTSLAYNQWIPIKESQKNNVCPSPPKTILYSKQIETKELILTCSASTFFDKKNPFESKIKQDIQKSFALTNDTHKGNIYLMWIDVNHAMNSTKPLYNKTDHPLNKKYCISKISDITTPRTALLTGKEILEAADKAPIRHLLDTTKDKGNYQYPALTWVRSINQDPNRRLLFITTVYESDFDNKIDSSFWKILPASLLALLLAFIAGFFLFRRLFKSINSLSHTAQLVNEGKMNIRSHIKGDDDIGILSSAFNNMLDSIEKNIKNLDLQVEDKTKELRASLDEKETLLKEIHHRVKNNLAMTINLIKLQKIKLKDPLVKQALSDVQERIYTMELLHRKLYESKDLNSIPVQKYIEELIEDIKQTYKTTTQVKTQIHVDDIFMNIEYALPCGLIINEALTNAFKYAVKNNQLHIFIGLKKQQDDFELIIQDSGEGLPSNINIKTTKSLGLRLIHSIVTGQLLGAIELSCEKGTRFVITFKKFN